MTNKHFQLVLCSAALLGGIIALIHWGATPPPWLAGTEAALIMALALSYGFTARLPQIPWLALRPVRGTILVMLGLIMLMIQPQLIVAAYLIGRGIRLVWSSACQLAASKPHNDPRLVADANATEPVEHHSVAGYLEV
jgi:hypothetical protein